MILYHGTTVKKLENERGFSMSLKNQISLETKVATMTLISLKEILSWVGKDLVEYMDENNLWVLFDDSDLMVGTMNSGLEDTLVFFGGGLSEDEKCEIVSRYNSKYQCC